MRRNSSGQSDIGPVGCSGNFYSSRSNRTLCSPAGGFPFSKKISLLHSHVLFLLYVELNLVLVMGYCLVFIFVLRSEEHTSELQSRPHLVCRLLLEKKKNKQ